MERAVVITGVGGQGIQLAAKLLAEAALREGREVMTFGVFMGMVRGGSSESTVVLADAEIVSPPIVPEVWGVVALHPGGLDRLAPKVRPGGVLVVDAGLVPAAPAWEGVHRVALPATALAQAAGTPVGASMVALGALAAATGLVAVEALEAALADVLPPHRRAHAERNARCLRAGAEHVVAAVPAAAAWI
jgi:2-oxoglutarate ferredoxin oxidoreductase subunit gamma